MPISWIHTSQPNTPPKHTLFFFLPLFTPSVRRNNVHVKTIISSLCHTHWLSVFTTEGLVAAKQFPPDVNAASLPLSHSQSLMAPPALQTSDLISDISAVIATGIFLNPATSSASAGYFCWKVAEPWQAQQQEHKPKDTSSTLWASLPSDYLQSCGRYLFHSSTTFHLSQSVVWSCFHKLYASELFSYKFSWKKNPIMIKYEQKRWKTKGQAAFTLNAICTSGASSFNVKCVLGFAAQIVRSSKG